MAKGRQGKKYRIRPYSRATGLAKVNRSTREGQALEHFMAELSEHVGGKPTVAEQMLIEEAAMIKLRLALMAPQMITAKSMSTARHNEYLAWQNTLRRHLSALGLKASSRGKGVSKLDKMIDGQ